MPSQDTEEQDRGGSRGQWCFEQPDGTYSPERPKCIDYGQRRLVVVPWPPATTTGTAEASTSVPEGATPPPPPPTSSRDVPAAAEHGQPAAAEHGRTSGIPMEVLAWGDAATLNRPCVDCSRVTGCFCDGCFAIQRDPDAYWAPGQHTPLCTACDAKHGECHHCRGLAWVAPRVWGDGAKGVGADETDPDPAPPSRAKPAPPRAPSSYGAQPATPPPPPPTSSRDAAPSQQAATSQQIGNRPHDDRMRELGGGDPEREWWMRELDGVWWTRLGPQHGWYVWEGNTYGASAADEDWDPGRDPAGRGRRVCGPWGPARVCRPCPMCGQRCTGHPQNPYGNACTHALEGMNLHEWES